MTSSSSTSTPTTTARPASRSPWTPGDWSGVEFYGSGVEFYGTLEDCLEHSVFGTTCAGADPRPAGHSDTSSAGQPRPCHYN